MEGPGLPRGIVGRLEEGIWQEWDGVCTIEHTIIVERPLRHKKRRGEENEILFTSLGIPHIQGFLGSFRGVALTKWTSSEVKHLKGLFITHSAGKSSPQNHIVTSIQYYSQERKL